jgi:RNA polymerase sigma-70 factor (ECF subfamily)
VSAGCLVFRQEKQFPASWSDPRRALEDKNCWEVFETCSRLMPARTARVFIMREVMELTSDEICKKPAIMPTNLWVMRHRARLRLRECLEIKWFGDPGK